MPKSKPAKPSSSPEAKTPKECTAESCPVAGEPTSDEETMAQAVMLIEKSDWAGTAEGRKVVKKIQDLRKEGKIQFKTYDNKQVRGEWTTEGISVSSNYNRDPEATASELVHEATHGVDRDEHGTHAKSNSIDEEMRTNTNQLDFYAERRKDNSDYRDSGLDKRQKDRDKDKLRENIERRYPDAPQHRPVEEAKPPE